MSVTLEKKHKHKFSRQWIAIISFSPSNSLTPVFSTFNYIKEWDKTTQVRVEEISVRWILHPWKTPNNLFLLLLPLALVNYQILQILKGFLSL